MNAPPLSATPAETQRAARVHRRGVVAALLLSFAVGTAHAASPRPLAPNHPLLGTWTFTAPSDGCVETWVIRPDGTARVTGGDEVVETAMDVADQPDAHGAYRWADRVVHSNGQGDCSGDATPVGRQWTSYIRFDATARKMAVCQDAALRECIGPYRRATPRADEHPSR